ncbi:cation diffusion facilitator family transporter [Hansschlegelia plantiphila]|uniref:Cobalt transporter n=1 Tax=Hansschlegelia plantiphila TaxID=374655 RepID=A0A9W6J2A6_9HYPH|nr:cation diffusion facilitator family transporter [Hansschlegelia plantiphila]GLK68078.1 cobalt transporter [Hansschlegelia plantiphila]
MTEAHIHHDHDRHHGDDHAAAQGHGGHGHSHAPADYGRAFAIGAALNIAFVLVEAGFGIAANSTALLSDAGHNLSDVLGLGAAWLAHVLSSKPPSERFTYGLKASSILAALFNAVFLLVAVGAIAWEAVTRLFHPAETSSGTVMAVAAAGILVNGVTAWLFFGGRKGDLNVKGAYLHMAADAAVSAGVMVAGLVIWLTGWFWLDPAVSLVIAGLIIWGTWGLLSDSVAMSLNAAPERCDPKQLEAFLAALPGVSEVHDLHVWSMSTTDVVLTAHLTMAGGHPGDGFLIGVAEELRKRYGIGHSTVQIETDPATPCVQRSANAV